MRWQAFTQFVLLHAKHSYYSYSLLEEIWLAFQVEPAFHWMDLTWTHVCRFQRMPAPSQWWLEEIIKPTTSCRDFFHFPWHPSSCIQNRLLVQNSSTPYPLFLAWLSKNISAVLIDQFCSFCPAGDADRALAVSKCPDLRFGCFSFSFPFRGEVNSCFTSVSSIHLMNTQPWHTLQKLT